MDLSYVHVPGKKRRKLDPKSEKMVLARYILEQVGFSDPITPSLVDLGSCSIDHIFGQVGFLSGMFWSKLKFF